MMRKRIWGVLIMLVALFAYTSSSLAAIKYASEPVYMREGPSTKHNIILELQTGDQVDATEISGNWSKVSFNGKTGYVFSKYLTSDKVNMINSATTTAKVNVRSGPGTNYKRLGSLKKGATIQIVGYDGNWNSFLYNGKIAYVHTDYLQFKKSSSVDDVLQILQDEGFYTNYADDIFAVITNDTNTKVSIRISNTTKAQQLKKDLSNALKGLPYKIIHTSFPNYVNQSYLNDLSQSIFEKYNSLSTSQKSQFIITEAYYNMNDDKFYVGIVNLNKTRENLFKRQISSWPYITLISIDDIPMPKT